MVDTLGAVAATTAEMASGAGAEIAASATGAALEGAVEAGIATSLNATEAATSIVPDLPASTLVDRAIVMGDPTTALQQVADMPDIPATPLNPRDILNDTRAGKPDLLPKNPSTSSDTVDPGLKQGSENAPPFTRDVSEEAQDAEAEPATLEGFLKEYDDAPQMDQPTEEAVTQVDTTSTVKDQTSPEMARDALSAEIQALKRNESPTPEQQQKLDAMQTELKERDELQTLKAAEPQYLNAQGQARMQELSKKYEGTQAEATDKTQEAVSAAAQDNESEQVTQELQDPGDFDEEAVRQELDTDRQRTNLTEEQKQAYINEKRAEHDQKKSEYDAQKAEKEGEQEKTTAEKKAKLDDDLKKTQEDLVEGRITPKQAQERLKRNERARRDIVNSLVEQFKDGKDLTPFEKEVAEKAMRMQELMIEIQVAPKILGSMEKTIGEMKNKYKEAAQFKITPENADTPEARKNIAIRAGLANQIAAQAAHMAKYSDIVSVNVNEFRSVNSSLMSLIGVRDGFVNMMVQIDTGIRRKVKAHINDATARQIAARA